MRYIIVLLVFVVTACGRPVIEQDIVLIGIDSLSRGKIGEVISLINTFNPSVVAVDVIFPDNNKTDNEDIRLRESLEGCKTLVMAAEISGYGRVDWDFDFDEFQLESEAQFVANANVAFTNAIVEKDKTLKHFSSYETFRDKKLYHFSIQTTLMFDSTKTSHFLETQPKINEVDYDESYKNIKRITGYEVLNKSISYSDVNKKIVMIGYLGPTDEDMWYTPHSKSRGGKKDIYGVEHLACIVIQVLKSGK